MFDVVCIIENSLYGVLFVTYVVNNRHTFYVTS